MEAWLTLLSGLIAAIAFTTAAELSGRAGTPHARPWLAAFYVASAFVALYAGALSAGFAMRWPLVHWLAAPWLALMLFAFARHLRESEQRRGLPASP